MLNIVNLCCGTLPFADRHPPSDMEMQQLKSLYQDRGVLLADHIFKTMNEATDKLLDLEAELSASNLNPEKTTPRHPLDFRCNTSLVDNIRSKQICIQTHAEEEIETTIAKTFYNLEQQFKTTVNTHELSFGEDKKIHQQVMENTISTLRSTELRAMKTKLADERILEPCMTKGDTLSLIQLKFRLDGDLYFPPLAPLETHFNCKLPETELA